MTLVVLWTDALVYLLLGVVVAFAWYARRREHLRAPWRRVARRPMGMGALVVLAFFALIGLLDTAHLRPAGPEGGEVLSLLDILASTQRTGVEKTYSAPFATHLYTKEPVAGPGGEELRIYPRLHHAGAHLKDPARDRLPDIAAKVTSAALHALSWWAGVVFLTVALLAWRHGVSLKEAWHSARNGRWGIPWAVVLGTAGVLLVVSLVAWRLSLSYHILGTDKVGEDVFYQSLKSVRTGLVIGTLSTLVMLPFALWLGIMAGYFGGWVDDVIQYLYTTLNSIPGVLLIAAAILLLQVYITNHPELFDSVTARADVRLLFLCIILGLTSWTGLCRLLRGESLKLREVDYVQAAVALGVGHARIIARHLLPNVMHIVLINVVLDFSGLVLAEAVLSYVGVGVDPSTYSWGNMINAARLEMAREPIVWWSLCAAFLFMFTLVLSANLFSDAVRDAFDPRLARSR